MFLPALRLDWDIDKRQTSTLLKESQKAGENLIFWMCVASVRDSRVVFLSVNDVTESLRHMLQTSFYQLNKYFETRQQTAVSYLQEVIDIKLNGSRLVCFH